MRRRVAVAMAAVALAAACSSGSDGAAAKSFTTTELLAALPAPTDVPGSVESSVCPGDPERCSPPDPNDTTEVSTRIVLEPVSAAATRLAQQAQQAVDVDTAYVRAGVEDQAGDARARWIRLWDGNTDVYDGDYSVDRGGDLTERGIGSVEPFVLTGWQGFMTVRSIRRPDGASRAPAILTAEIHLVRAGVAVDALVYLAAGDRSPDAACSLADQLARDYVTRLGQPAGLIDGVPEPNR